jgi:hypothetical protein
LTVFHRTTGVRRSASALAAISRRTVQLGRKQGRDWCGGMEVAVLSAYCELRASVRLSPCARGTTRCRDRDPSDRSARRRTFRKTAQRARHQRNRKHCTRHHAAAPCACADRAKPAAEFFDDVVVLAHDLIGTHGDLVRPIRGRSSSLSVRPLRRVMC